MNQLFVVLMFVVTLVFSQASFAGEHYAFGEVRTTISAYSDTSEKDHYEEFYGFYSYGLTDMVGVFAFVGTNTDSRDEGYAQGYAGAYLRPVEWLEVGLGYGAERFDMEVEEEQVAVSGKRFGSYVDIPLSKGTISLVFEDGESGYYYEARATANVTKELGLGAIAMREIGYGPRIEFGIPVFASTKLIASGAYLIGDEDKGEPKNSTMLSLQLEFGG